MPDLLSPQQWVLLGEVQSSCMYTTQALSVCSISKLMVFIWVDCIGLGEAIQSCSRIPLWLYRDLEIHDQSHCPCMRWIPCKGLCIYLKFPLESVQMQSHMYLGSVYMVYICGNVNWPPSLQRSASISSPTARPCSGWGASRPSPYCAQPSCAYIKGACTLLPPPPSWAIDWRPHQLDLCWRSSPAPGVTMLKLV